MHSEDYSNRVGYWYAAIGLVAAVALVVTPDIVVAAGLPFWAKFIGYAVVSAISGASLVIVYRTSGVFSPTPLSIVAYDGYDAYLNSIAPRLRRKYKVVVTPHGYMGEEIFSLLNRTKADLLIFDIEHCEALTALTSDNRLIQLAELSRYSDNFPEVKDLVNVSVPAVVPRIEGQAMGFPIRLGTNCVSFNRNYIGHHGSAESLRELIFGTGSLSTKLREERRIGVWKRQSVVMGLVSLALDNREPYRLTPPQFETLCAHLTKLRRSTARMYWGPTDYLRLKDDLNEGLIWLAIGGGEWHVDSRSSRRFSQRPNIDWCIPREGALLWVESVGITQGCLKKLLSTSLSVEDLVELIRGELVNLEAQHTLSLNHLYAACPISYDDLLTTKRDQYAFLGYSGPEEITRKISDGQLVFRSRPPLNADDGWVPRSEWDNYWQSEWGR